MKKNIGIISCFLSILILLSPALGADASLLPNAVQQFFSSSGAPLNNGKVWFYEVGTSTLKNVYTSSAATTPYTNPITLNAGGKPPGASGIYGIGLYRQLVKDSANNVVWDAVTAPGGGGSTPTNVGDGNLVGTILPWSGLTAPNQYVFTYGQELARATHPEFFTAITQQSNVICTSASNILTGIADTTQIRVGSPIELAPCVVPGTTVTSKTGATVTLSNPSSVSINSVAVFFPYGNGDGSTTFNAPDLRDVTLAGRPNMGGSDRGLLTTTYYGANPAGLGVLGGSQSATISQANFPNITLNTAIASGQGSHGHGYNVPGSIALNTGATASDHWGGGIALGNTAAATLPAMTGTTPLGGSATPMSVVQPTITINYIIKITPDTSASSVSGVASLGGMTGIISCGSGLLCTGNTVSVNTGIFSNQNANLVFAGPSSGAAATPAFRSLISDDLPNIPVTKLNSGTSASSSTYWRGDGTWAAPPGSILASNNTFTGDNLFRSGRPWCDVRAYGAVGDGVTNDQAAFQNCINLIITNFGGSGVVYVPSSPNPYCVFTQVSITGATSGITIRGAGVQNSVMSACGHNITVLEMNSPYAIVENLYILGYGFGTDTFGGATVPALVIDTLCSFCKTDHILVNGGSNNIQVQASNYYIIDTQTQYAYGSAMVYFINGGGYVSDSHFDQVWPVADPAYGTVIGAWAGSTACTVGKVVSLFGYYMQYSTTGTSGSGGPTLKNYGQAITDGTCTAYLVGPTTYYALQADTGVNELQIIRVDTTGSFIAGLALTNTFAGTPPTSVTCTDCVSGGTIGQGVRASAGSKLVLQNFHMSRCVASACQAVALDINWAGPALINNLRVENNVGYGVFNVAGSQATVSNSHVESAAVAALYAGGTATKFIYTGNQLGSANNAAAISTQATAGVNYCNITNNIVTGAVAGVTIGAGSCVVNTNTGNL